MDLGVAPVSARSARGWGSEGGGLGVQPSKNKAVVQPRKALRIVKPITW